MSTDSDSDSEVVVARPKPGISSRARALVGVTALAAIGLFAYTQYLIFFAAEMQDFPLYFSQKIFYYHVPCAMMLFAAVIHCGIYSVLYLRRRERKYDEIAEAAAEVAVLFGAVMLITGSIWGEAAWDTWWEWKEVRLVSSLLLEMIMVAYLLVRRYGGPGSERLAAGLGVFGMVDVPLIYVSVHLWNLQHPKTSVVPGLMGTQRLAFWMSFLLFVAVYALVMTARLAYGRTQRRLNDARERALDAGLVD